LSKKESFFLWSTGGIRRIRRRLRVALGARPSRSGGFSPFSESRRYPRLDLEFPILYKVLGETNQRIPSEVRPYLLARSTNVSPLGLCMSLGEKLPNGTVLALTLHVVDRREKFHAIGRVTWTRPAAELPGRFLTGIQFVVVEGETVKREEHTRMSDVIGEKETR
jgi:hypothetical protein